MKKLFLLTVAFAACTIYSADVSVAPDFFLQAELPAVDIPKMSVEITSGVQPYATQISQALQERASTVFTAIKNDSDVALQALRGFIVSLFKTAEDASVLEKLAESDSVDTITQAPFSVPVSHPPVFSAPASTSTLDETSSWEMVKILTQRMADSLKQGATTVQSGALYVGDQISKAPAVVTEFYQKNLVPVYTDIVVPVANRSAEIVQEALVCGSDVFKAVGSGIQGSGKLVQDHPHAAALVAAAVVARMAYVSYVVPGNVIRECQKINAYLVDAARATNALNLGDIDDFEESLLWHAGIYYRTKYGTVMIRSIYRHELQAIYTFTGLLRAAKVSRAVTVAHYAQITRAAEVVKIVLTRRLSVADAALV